MTDAPTPEQAAGLQKPDEAAGEKPRLQIGKILTQQTYTWTCPRCGWKHPPALSPLYSPACAVCNYPDPPPPGYRGVIDPDEQATEIARMAAAANPEDAEAQAALDAERRDEGAVYDREGNLVVPDPQSLAAAGEAAVPVVQTAPAAPHAPAKIDRGWLAVCIEKELNAHGSAIINAEGTPVEDYLGFTESVIEWYEGERWTLLCGCLAGVHGDSIPAMAAAHPDRVRQ